MLEARKFNGRGPTLISRAVLAAVLALLLAAPAASADLEVSPPLISDTTPEVGQTLTATAQWGDDDDDDDARPYRLDWRWERCAASGCVEVTRFETETAGTSGWSTYTVTPGDVGSQIRVRLRVRRDGEQDWGVSARTAAVLEPPPPEPEPTPTPTPAPTGTGAPFDQGGTATPPPDPLVAPGTGGAVLGEASPRMMSPFPVVRIRGRLTLRGARLSLLTVRSPRGARIRVACRGDDCPTRRWARTARTSSLTRVKRFQRSLDAGTRLIITVKKPRRIGKHTTILIRRARAPKRNDRCLYPGSSRPVACPTG